MICMCVAYESQRLRNITDAKYFKQLNKKNQFSNNIYKLNSNTGLEINDELNNT